MAEPNPSSPPRTARALLAGTAGVAAHAAGVGVGFLAGRLVRPSPDGELEGLFAVVMALLSAEAVAAVACAVAVTLLVRRRRPDAAVGLVVGWVVGAVGAWILICA